MADKIVRATVEGDRPVFINGILHLRGEDASANLDELGVKELGDKTPGLAKKSAKADENVAEAPIAAVAPHAPDAPNPQGMAPGTVQSGTGRLITPTFNDEEPAIQPVGAEAPVTASERKEAGAETRQVGSTQRPAKPSK
jgi:hypothetical protein